MCHSIGESIFIRLIVLAAIMLFSTYGFSYQKDDFLVRAGVAFIDPKEDSDSIDLGGIKLGKIGVESQSVPLVNLSYFATDHLAFELLLSRPPVLAIVGTTGLIKGAPIGNIEAYPLVVTAQYFPMDATSRWQPFVGFGFNYIVPGDTNVHSDLAPRFGAENIELEVDRSLGITLAAGLDFMVTDKFSLSAQAYYLDIEAQGNGKVIIGDQKIDLHLFAQTGYAPVLYSFTLGYIF